MKIRKKAKIETSYFWYDLFEGGYIKPEQVLQDIDDDIEKVLNAIRILKEFRKICEDITEYI